MKGFKDSTRTQYSMGGAAYAKGGSAKGAAKVAKVMGEFKKGELHSGSKEGPKVTKPAQAKAIAMSEARKAGMKAPMKKNEGGKIGKMPPLGESVKSGNRMSKMTAAERLAMEARFGEKKRPSPGDSVKSGNRIAKEEAAEARHLGVFKEGGKVRKYAEGGAVSGPDLNETMSNLRNQFGVMGNSGQYDMRGLQDLVNSVNTAYSQRGATADQVKDAYMRGFTNLQKTPSGVGSAPGVGGAPVDIEMRKRPPMMEQLPPMMMEPAPLKMMERMEPQMPPPLPPPVTRTYDKFRPQVMPPLMMEQPTPPLQNLGEVLQRIQQKQPPVDRGFIDRMPRMNVPEGPPPAGMAPVDPNKAMMMKHGGRAAMSKGKR
jgi:hypothetical protein